MPKGSKPAGNVTTTNITGQKQEPYLEDLWSQAQRLNNAWTPGATIGNAGENINFSAWDDLVSTGKNTSNVLRPQANQTWTGIASDPTGANSPAYNYWQQMANFRGTQPQMMMHDASSASSIGAGDYAKAIGPYAQQANQYGQTAAAGNLGLDALGKVAGGEFLNKNPYIAQMVQNAMDPITRNYQTATAPQLDASFAGSGRYGSGAMLGARDTAQRNLGKTLSDASTTLYGNQYQNERQLMDQAASQYGTLYNQGQQLGMQGAQAGANIYNTAGNQYQTGLQNAANIANQDMSAMQGAAQGLQQGYQTGTNAATQAAAMYPQLAQAQSIGEQQQMAAGDAYNKWQERYKTEPYDALTRYQQLIGSPIGAGTSQPYFQNQGANIMSGITGGLDIMTKLGGLGKI